MKKLLPIFLTMLVSANALAATAYVSDKLAAPLRRGHSSQSRISGSVHSGQKIETLDTAAGYTKVRTSSGSTGWVLTRFLSDSPSAEHKLEQARKRLAQAQEQNHDLQEKLGNLQNDKSSLSEARTSLETKNAKLKKQLSNISDKAAHTLKIDKTNQKLEKSVSDLHERNARLQAQNKALKSQHRGIVIGAVVLIIGILLGLIIPRLRVRRRSAWDRY